MALAGACERLTHASMEHYVKRLIVDMEGSALYADKQHHTLDDAADCHG